MPAWKKVITSGSDASLNTLQLTNLGSQNETLIVGTANQVTSSNILSLDTTNNRVGIGTASPAYQVEIENTGANALLVLQRTDGASCFIEGQSARSAFGSVGATPLALAYNSLAVVTIGASGAITVNPDGDGFTFPTTDGSANQVLQTDGNGTLSFADVAGGGSSVWYDGTTYITSSADVQITGSLQIYKSGSTVFNIEGSQGTLFTVTDELSGSLFSVNDISGIPIFEVFSDDTVKIGTYSAEGIEVQGSDVKITGSLAVGNISPNATDGRIDASNDVVAFSTSDIRWKTNIKTIESPLEKLQKLSGVEFDWIEDWEVHGNVGNDVGVIAQEVELVLPQAVQTRDSGMKAVRYEKLIPLLIETIKEQQKQIDELKNKIG